MNELKLKVRVTKAGEELKLRKTKLTSLRRQLDTAESEYIEAREIHRRAEEELTEFQRTNVGETSLDDERLQLIDEYRQRMPASMERIKNEAPLAVAGLLDLDTTSSPGYIASGKKRTWT